MKKEAKGKAKTKPEMSSPPFVHICRTIDAAVAFKIGPNFQLLWKNIRTAQGYNGTHTTGANLALSRVRSYSSGEMTPPSECQEKCGIYSERGSKLRDSHLRSVCLLASEEVSAAQDRASNSILFLSLACLDVLFCSQPPTVLLRLIPGQ